MRAPDDLRVQVKKLRERFNELVANMKKDYLLDNGVVRPRSGRHLISTGEDGFSCWTMGVYFRSD